MVCGVLCCGVVCCVCICVCVCVCVCVCLSVCVCVSVCCRAVVLIFLLSTPPNCCVQFGAPLSIKRSSNFKTSTYTPWRPSSTFPPSLSTLFPLQTAETAYINFCGSVSLCASQPTQVCLDTLVQPPRKFRVGCVVHVGEGMVGVFVAHSSR